VGLGLSAADLPSQMDRGQWSATKERFAAIFATRTRDEWAKIYEGTDACVSPVLSTSEAAHYDHNVARATFVDAGGVQPAPAPRFSITAPSPVAPAQTPGSGTRVGLSRWGIPDARIDELLAAGALG
jgi:alpha-methylacyl-CoA racemase